MTRIEVALLTTQGGCQDRTGRHDFSRLHHAATGLRSPAALWLIGEAKRWRADRNRAMFAAAEALSDAAGVAYTAVLGTSPRGALPPAIIYNPDVLVLRSWANPDDPEVYRDQLNVARFAVRSSGPTRNTRKAFTAWVGQWHPSNRSVRRQEADDVARYGDIDEPVIAGVDANESPSGPHLPQRNLARASYQRLCAEARQRADTTWVHASDAIDHLIGRWDNGLHDRVGGCGYYAVAELAWQANPAMALLPTINHDDDCGAVIKDLLLVNRTARTLIDPASYRTHIPPGDDPHTWPSDHRLVTAAIEL
jgi:hypothetical protein